MKCDNITEMFYMPVKFDNVFGHFNDFTWIFHENAPNLSVEKWRHKVKCIPAFFINFARNSRNDGKNVKYVLNWYNYVEVEKYLVGKIRFR